LMRSRDVDEVALGKGGGGTWFVWGDIARARLTESGANVGGVVCNMCFRGVCPWRQSAGGAYVRRCGVQLGSRAGWHREGGA